MDLESSSISFQGSLVEGTNGPVLIPTKIRRSHRQVSGYVGDRTNVGQSCTASTPPDSSGWSSSAPGTVAHGVADEGDTMRSVAEVIGRQLDLPVEAILRRTSDSGATLSPPNSHRRMH